MDKALKFIDATDDTLILEGPIVLYGGQDLTGEYFHKGTDFESSYTAIGRIPVDWEHGTMPDRDERGAIIPQPGRDDVLGYIDWMTKRNDDIGLLARYALNRRDRYVREFVEPLAKANLVGASSEATADIIINNGRIDKWPLKRQALTLTPCEPRMLSQHQLQVVKSLIEFYPNLKALLPQAPGDGAEGATDGALSTQIKARAFLLVNKG